MITLPEDYCIEEYGLKARFVTEEDAQFIVSLRSNKERTKYMVTLDESIEKQKLWIRDYKTRESKGEDYFFIYSNSKNEPISIFRISKIDFNKNDCKAGSWIKIKGSRCEAMSIFVFHCKIIFEVLLLDSFYADIHKNNERSISYFNLSNFEGVDILSPYKEEDDFVYFRVFYEDYVRAKISWSTST